jgi:hypothetical protein
MRYKNPTPNPLIACDEGAKMYLIRAETAVSRDLPLQVREYSWLLHHLSGIYTGNAILGEWLKVLVVIFLDFLD